MEDILSEVVPHVVDVRQVGGSPNVRFRMFAIKNPTLRQCRVLGLETAWLENSPRPRGWRPLSLWR